MNANCVYFRKKFHRQVPPRVEARQVDQAITLFPVRLNGALDRTRTCDLSLRRQLLCPAELRGRCDGGAEGDRTPDLRIANATLSQLSYGPDLICPPYLDLPPRCTPLGLHDDIAPKAHQTQMRQAQGGSQLSRVIAKTKKVAQTSRLHPRGKRSHSGKRDACATWIWLNLERPLVGGFYWGTQF